MKYCSMYCSVSAVSFVREPSVFFKVDKFTFAFLLPVASLYTTFQGLLAGVRSQYAFQDLSLAFLIVEAYLAFPSRYCVLRWDLRTSLFVVLWNLRLNAF